MNRSVVCVLLLVACSGSDKGTQSEETDVAVDTASEIFVPLDVVEVEVETRSDTTADVEADTDPNCNTFGCRCNSNADCLDELCIEGQDGFICTKTCSVECPQGYDCLTTTALGPDPLSLCVPRHVPLCRPCMAHSDCAGIAGQQGFCLPATDADQGRFCGSGCSNGLPCPEGFTCDTVQVDGGNQVEQCRPISGLCECRPGWATQPYETTCVVANDIGRCGGTRTCGADGLTACSGTLASAESCNREDDDCNGVTDDVAATACEIVRGADACPGTRGCVDGSEVCLGTPPAAEQCNGIDDDCDSATDESTCFDGLDCTSDVCAGGECSNALMLGACIIDGVCYQAGATKPDDLCQTCQPDVSTTSFTLAEGIACDDFEACTQQDTCRAGTCVGTTYTCDDGLACTRDTCDGQGGCTTPLSPNSCLIDNVCYADGTKREAGSCEVCDSTTSTSSWSGSTGGACNDGDPCTTDDVCDRICRGTQYACDDGDACTVDLCDGVGGCVNSVADERCNIGGACYAAGTTKPDEPCYVCDPTKDDEAWTVAAPGASCDDGNSCTSNDMCNSGICRGTTYECSDALACTTNACDGNGGCFVTVAADSCVVDNTCVAAGTRSAIGSCRACVPSTNSNGWTALDGQDCNDGQACTKDDTCTGEVCAGTAYACDDDNACTIDTCNGDGTCSNEQATTSCIINGACVAANATKPGESCLACRPDVSTTQWSVVAPNTACDDGNACSRSDVCNAGVCAGTAYSCNDNLNCTADSCDGNGGCVNAVNAGACNIEGACFVAGALAALGDCRVCDPSTSNTAWSPRTGQSCNDGASCTKDDVCSGTTCQGTPYTCDDNIVCTADSCDGDGTCTFTLAQGACVIAGTCYPDGAQKANEPCYACRPDISGTTWSPALVGTECNDRNACTSEDECSNGLCAGQPYTCNDGLACTNDACDGVGECTYTIAPNSCLIAGVCVAAGTLQTAGGCLWCDPTVDPRGWSPRAGASCSDGTACTSNDRCVGSTCQGTTYSCNDNLACTTDSCNGDGTCTNTTTPGSCVIGGACYAENTTKPGDVCLACRPSLANNDWRPVGNGAVCNDGAACTSNDVCTSGICGGTPYVCNDNKACTTDICDGAGACAYSVNAGNCLIGGTCYTNGTTQGTGAAACFVCTAATSQQSWSPNGGATCSDGNSCTRNDVCSGTSCGGTTYSCNDNNACTLDACNGDGTCSNTQAPSTCIIAGVCYASGFAKPGEPCFACRPEISASTWSAVAAGASCDDNNACTRTDTCNAGACAGIAYTCNDGLNCTTDSCNGDGTCSTTVNAGTCRIQDVCYNNTGVNPNDACLVCTAATSQSTWSPNNGATCSDKNPCTSADKCNGSTCGGTLYGCNDNLTCTNDSCNGDGTCTNALTAGFCKIGNACQAAGADHPTNPCLECRPDISTSDWSPLAVSVACNDRDACTHTDRCSNGACSGTAAPCTDSLACTDLTCNGAGGCITTVNSGGCAITNACYASGATDPSNPCKVCNPALDAFGWSNKADGTTCSDVNACTHTDKCNAGSCVGTAYVCNDGLSCTDQTCNGVGGCTTTVTTGCAIGTACVVTGTDNPSNPCQECNPSQSTTTYTAGNSGAVCNDGNNCSHTDRCNTTGGCAGTSFTCNDNNGCTNDACNGTGCTYTNNTFSCSDGTSCTINDVCGGGVCDGTDVLDQYEPNNSSRGRNITNVDDCDDPAEHSINATIFPVSDVDWYQYYDDDRFGCSIFPDVRLVNLPVGTDYDLEVFAWCPDGSAADVSCPTGTDIGNGCRSNNGVNASEHVRLNPNCSGSDDDVWVVIRVYRWSGPETCDSYTLQWGDD